MLLPSTNWDAAVTPYTNYNAGSATPTVSGNSHPQQHMYKIQTQNLPLSPLPPQPQKQTSEIPRPKLQQFVA
jgi:hypothetical protein